LTVRQLRSNLPHNFFGPNVGLDPGVLSDGEVKKQRHLSFRE
jgi:hypothetical protein